MRTSNDEFKNGLLWNGYDYDRQAWVVDGIYQDCGHPSYMKAQQCCEAHELAGRSVEHPTHTEDCLDANDDTSVFKGRCICPKADGGNAEKVA